MTAALDIDDISVDLGGRRVVDHASLAVNSGEFIGLVGPNGGGKTTLIRAALGLVRPAVGQAFLAGDPVRALSTDQRARRVGYLAQERIIGWNLPAWRLAALGAPLQPPAVARAHALEALHRVGASHLAERGVLDLSGGERAKILLARLLATRAPLLVADEPVAGLDPAAQFDTLECLRDHAKAGGAVLATLHDLTLAARFCERVAVMAGGRLIAIGSPESVLTPTNLKAAFALSGEIQSTRHGPIVAAARFRGA